jgi:hypothetical protein
MAFGQSRTAAHFNPERSILLHEPLLISKPTNARQLPSFEFGNPPKLQPQPKSQLQNSYPRPLRAHRVAFAFAATCPPPVKLSNNIQIAENIHFLDEERGGGRSEIASASWESPSHLKINLFSQSGIQEAYGRLNRGVKSMSRLRPKINSNGSARQRLICRKTNWNLQSTKCPIDGLLTRIHLLPYAFMRR